MEATQEPPQELRPITPGCVAFGLIILAAFVGGMVFAFALMGMANGG